jgi:hypothetical protein
MARDRDMTGEDGLSPVSLHFSQAFVEDAPT